MRDSIIKDTSYLGPYNHPTKLKVRNTQRMIFPPTDEGPFYLSEKERQEQRMDQYNGTKREHLNKSDLIEALKQHGVTNPKGSKGKLQKLCKKNNLPIVHEIPDVKQGWANKQKGSFQVLYERGWIDPEADPKGYTIHGTLEEYGNRSPKKSLKQLISVQPDFLCCSKYISRKWEPNQTIHQWHIVRLLVSE